MDALLLAALKARENAHAPYSNFKVGAAIEDDSGRIHTGCNVENATYGLTLCAERVAVFKAISEGARKFRRIAVATDRGVACSDDGVVQVRNRLQSVDRQRSWPLAERRLVTSACRVLHGTHEDVGERGARNVHLERQTSWYVDRPTGSFERGQVRVPR